MYTLQNEALIVLVLFVSCAWAVKWSSPCSNLEGYRLHDWKNIPFSVSFTNYVSLPTPIAKILGARIDLKRS